MALRSDGPAHHLAAVAVLVPVPVIVMMFVVVIVIVIMDVVVLVAGGALLHVAPRAGLFDHNSGGAAEQTAGENRGCGAQRSKAMRGVLLLETRAIL